MEKNILESHKLRRCEKRVVLHSIVGKAVYLDYFCGPSHTIRGSWIVSSCGSKTLTGTALPFKVTVPLKLDKTASTAAKAKDRTMTITEL